MPETASNRSRNQPAPLFAKASRLIGASALDRSEKAILRTLLQWWNPKTGELWPSMRSIAEATGFSIRGVQKIIRRLERAGALVRVLEPISKGRRGSTARTNVFRIEFAVLAQTSTASELQPQSSRPGTSPRSMSTHATLTCETPTNLKTCEETNLKNDEFIFGGERPLSAPRTEIVSTPERASSEAYKHEPATESSIAPGGRGIQSSGLRAWMDAETSPDPKHARRVALIRAGVRGMFLHKLAMSEAISPEIVAREHRETLQDRNCRNSAAVLVSRLAEIAGIPLKRRAELTVEQSRLMGFLEQRRRQLGIRV